MIGPSRRRNAAGCVLAALLSPASQSQLHRFLDVPLTAIILGNTGTTDLDEFAAEIGKRLIE